MTESPNADKLKKIIGFLEYDAENEGGKAGLGNVERVAATFLVQNYATVLRMADAYDEADAQMAYDAEKMKA